MLFKKLKPETECFCFFVNENIPQIPKNSTKISLKIKKVPAPKISLNTSTDIFIDSHNSNKSTRRNTINNGIQAHNLKSNQEKNIQQQMIPSINLSHLRKKQEEIDMLKCDIINLNSNKKLKSILNCQSFENNLIKNNLSSPQRQFENINKSKNLPKQSYNQSLQIKLFPKSTQRYYPTRNSRNSTNNKIENGIQTLTDRTVNSSKMSASFKCHDADNLIMNQAYLQTLLNSDIGQ